MMIYFHVYTLTEVNTREGISEVVNNPVLFKEGLRNKWGSVIRT